MGDDLKKDIRPQVQDQIKKEFLLLDSGAQLSVWPKSRVPGAVLDPYVSIRAVNKSKILTYGKKEISVRFGRKQYNHTVIIADVDRPVLGWDFCKKFRLSLLWTIYGDLVLWDRIANITVPLQVTANKAGTWPNLEGFTVKDDSNFKAKFEIFACQMEEFRTFQQYAAAKKQESNE